MEGRERILGRGFIAFWVRNCHRGAWTGDSRRTTRVRANQRRLHDDEEVDRETAGLVHGKEERVMGFDGWWKLIVDGRGIVWEGRVWRVRGVRATVGADMGNEGMGRVEEGELES